MKIRLNRAPYFCPVIEDHVGEMLEILTQEFGERDEDGNVYDEPINFWMGW